MSNIYFTHQNTPRPLTPERKDQLFCCICDEICKYRAMYDDDNDQDLADEYCCICPVKKYL